MKVQLSELRDSWPAWLGVSLGILVTNFFVTLYALVIASGLAAMRAGDLVEQDSAAYVMGAMFSIAMCVIVGSVVIGSATSLVVDSRRGSLARLALAGATPGQVRGAVMWQLAVVSLVCTTVGSLLAVLTLPLMLRWLAAERTAAGGELIAPVYPWWGIPAATVLCLAIALLGGRKASKQASDIPAVAALRIAAAPDPYRMTPGRWVKASLCFVPILVLFGAVPSVAAASGKETVSNLFLMSITALILTGALLGQLSPLIVGPLTQAWTKLVPALDPSWTLARSGVIAKSGRLAKSVVPVMMAVGLVFGLQLGGDIFTVIARDVYQIAIENAGIGTFLQVMGAPLAVSLSGGVGVLIMMSKQRDADLALSGVAGATPAQRIAMPILEALMITVTAALLSIVMVLALLGIMAWGLIRVGLWRGVFPSWSTFGGALGVSFLVVCAATLLPTLPSLRLPEPKVISRLVAE